MGKRRVGHFKGIIDRFIYLFFVCVFLLIHKVIHMYTLVLNQQKQNALRHNLLRINNSTIHYGNLIHVFTRLTLLCVVYHF